MNKNIFVFVVLLSLLMISGFAVAVNFNENTEDKFFNFDKNADNVFNEKDMDYWIGGYRYQILAPKHLLYLVDKIPEDGIYECDAQDSAPCLNIPLYTKDKNTANARSLFILDAFGVAPLKVFSQTSTPKSTVASFLPYGSIFASVSAFSLPGGDQSGYKPPVPKPEVGDGNCDEGEPASSSDCAPTLPPEIIDVLCADVVCPAYSTPSGSTCTSVPVMGGCCTGLSCTKNDATEEEEETTDDEITDEEIPDDVIPDITDEEIITLGCEADISTDIRLEGEDGNEGDSPQVMPSQGIPDLMQGAPSTVTGGAVNNIGITGNAIVGICGDKKCTTASGENPTNCPSDCGQVMAGGPTVSGDYEPWCGNGVKDFGEECDVNIAGGLMNGDVCTPSAGQQYCTYCSSSCKMVIVGNCGDGVCKANYGETAQNCAVDCRYATPEEDAEESGSADGSEGADGSGEGISNEGTGAPESITEEYVLDIDPNKENEECSGDEFEEPVVCNAISCAMPPLEYVLQFTNSSCFVAPLALDDNGCPACGGLECEDGTVIPPTIVPPVCDTLILCEAALEECAYPAQIYDDNGCMVGCGPMVCLNGTVINETLVETYSWSLLEIEGASPTLKVDISGSTGLGDTVVVSIEGVVSQSPVNSGSSTGVTGSVVNNIGITGNTITGNAVSNLPGGVGQATVSGQCTSGPRFGTWEGSPYATSGVCVDRNGQRTTISASCGDGMCTVGESSATCLVDCGSYCGDQVCNGGESYQSCGNDCVNANPLCGDTICDALESSRGTCQLDCANYPGTIPGQFNWCGNGAIDAGEQCDVNRPGPGGMNGDVCTPSAGASFCSYCTTSCTLAFVTNCGDNICKSQYGETQASCPADCTPPTPPQVITQPVCGNSQCEVAAGETVVSCPIDCQSNVGGPVCGNGVRETGEACDPGPNVAICSIATGQTSCSYCGASCQMITLNAPASCGNLVCEAGEAGSALGNSFRVGTCPADCTTPPPGAVCGNSVCDPTEDSTSCPADCTTPPPGAVCGNSVCDANEDATSCPADCTTTPPPGAVCGNSVCDANEDATSCPADCTTTPPPGPVCGNSVCDANEDSTSCPADCAGGNICISGNMVIQLPSTANDGDIISYTDSTGVTVRFIARKVATSTTTGSGGGSGSGSGSGGGGTIGGGGGTTGSGGGGTTGTGGSGSGGGLVQVGGGGVQICGDGIIEGGETCDAGSQNGLVCSITAGQTYCDYCSTDCLTVRNTAGAGGITPAPYSPPPTTTNPPVSQPIVRPAGYDTTTVIYQTGAYHTFFQYSTANGGTYFLAGHPDISIGTSNTIRFYPPGYCVPVSGVSGVNCLQLPSGPPEGFTGNEGADKYYNDLYKTTNAVIIYNPTGSAIRGITGNSISNLGITGNAIAGITGNVVGSPYNVVLNSPWDSKYYFNKPTEIRATIDKNGAQVTQYPITSIEYVVFGGNWASRGEVWNNKPANDPSKANLVGSYNSNTGIITVPFPDLPRKGTYSVIVTVTQLDSANGKYIKTESGNQYSFSYDPITLNDFQPSQGQVVNTLPIPVSVQLSSDMSGYTHYVKFSLDGGKTNNTMTHKTLNLYEGSITQISKSGTNELTIFVGRDSNDNLRGHRSFKSVFNYNPTSVTDIVPLPGPGTTGTGSCPPAPSCISQPGCTDIPPYLDSNGCTIGCGGSICQPGSMILTCNSVVYSDWSVCVNGLQTRSVLSFNPSGCSPIQSPAALSQSCASTTPTGTGGGTTTTGTINIGQCAATGGRWDTTLGTSGGCVYGNGGSGGGTIVINGGGGGGTGGGGVSVGNDPVCTLGNADCGNGLKEPGEICDAGSANGQVCNPIYGQSCDYCTATCTAASVTGPSCGDGIVQTNVVQQTGGGINEDCDLGSANGLIGPGTGNCQYCSNSCSCVTNNVGPFCGDFQCNNGESYLSCPSDCTNIPAQCGNGIMETGETCDDGILLNGVQCTANYNAICNYCDLSCQSAIGQGPYCGDNACNVGETQTSCALDCGLPPVCGNSVREGTEACDAGTLLNGVGCTPTYNSASSLSCTYCTASCTQGSVPGPYCGDMVCTVGQETVSTCPTDCIPTGAVCGNSVRENPEICDDGTLLNGVACTPTYNSASSLSCTYCTASCTQGSVPGPYCGDTICTAGKETQTSCGVDCGFPPVCGDGVISAGEACDSASSATIGGITACASHIPYGGSCYTCSASCLYNTIQGSRCGDFVCNTNYETQASCPSDCRPPTGSCGNYTIESGEACDAGPTGEPVCVPDYNFNVQQSCSYCTNLCNLIPVDGPFCGDGVCSFADGETTATCPISTGGDCLDDITPPNCPTSFSAIVTNQTAITLSWMHDGNDNPGGDGLSGFRLYRTNSPTAQSFITTASAQTYFVGGFSLTDNNDNVGLSVGTTYYYTIGVIDVRNNLALCHSLDFTNTTLSNAVVGSAFNFTIVSPSVGQVLNTSTVQFNVALNQLGGNVKYSLNKGLTNLTMGVDGTGFVFTDVNTGFVNGQYNMSVYAENASGAKLTGVRPFTVTIASAISGVQIDLASGWNYFSVPESSTAVVGSGISAPGASGTGLGQDKELSLGANWNLIGYSGVNDVQQSSLQFKGSDGNYKDLNTAAKEKRVQKRFVEYSADSQNFVYSTNTITEEGKAYWVYGREAGQLKAPAVDHPPQGQQGIPVRVQNIQFQNETSGQIKTLSEALVAGWIGKSGQNDDQVIQIWVNTILPSGATSGRYQEVSAVSLLENWKGYVVLSNSRDVKMIVPNA